GETIYELNPDRLFTPASVTKLYSTAATLNTLNADFRFETPVCRRGDVDSANVLNGDLILVASGDLTLDSRTKTDGTIAFTSNDHTYANGGEKGELTEPDPLAGINALARQVAEAGTKRVRGEVLIDDRLFDRDFGTGSGARGLTPIMIERQLNAVSIAPGERGQPAKVTCRPQSVLVPVDARVETVPTDGSLVTTLRGGAGHSIILTGKIPAGHKPLVRVYEVSDAASFARSLF